MSAPVAVTLEERTLLNHLESCAVIDGGKVAAIALSQDDLKILEKWNTSGFVSFGRIHNAAPGTRSFWVRLSDIAFIEAAQDRRARADRAWAERKWLTDKEVCK